MLLFKLREIIQTRPLTHLRAKATLEFLGILQNLRFLENAHVGLLLRKWGYFVGRRKSVIHGESELTTASEVRQESFSLKISSSQCSDPAFSSGFSYHATVRQR